MANALRDAGIEASRLATLTRTVLLRPAGDKAEAQAVKNHLR